MSSDDNEDSIVSLIYSPDECQFRFNNEAALEMVLIGLSKEPSTEDADASELVANGGGGPVQSTIHKVMKMISLSNIGYVIKACNPDVECTSSREDLPPTFRDASVKSELLMMKRNSIEYSFNSSAPFSV